MISKSAQYAIRAVVLIAAGPATNRGAQELAQRIDAPPNYMGKLLKQLADAGVLESTRGSGGGFRLARPAAEITLYDVVDPIDKLSRWTNCFLGLAGGCRKDEPCPIHPIWKPIRDHYLQMLETLTIANIPADRGEALIEKELGAFAFGGPTPAGPSANDDEESK